MAAYEWQTSDVWNKMHPRKKAIIETLVMQSRNKKMEESAGIVMAAVSQMRREKLSFTKQETALMLEVLTAGMSPAEKAKVEMMKNFFK